MTLCFVVSCERGGGFGVTGKHQGLLLFLQGFSRFSQPGIDIREVLVRVDEVRIELERLPIELDRAVVLACPVIHGTERFRRLRRNRVELQSLSHLDQSIPPIAAVS